jgi:hypothetical protein
MILMKGFPNHIATRQDYENLLSMDEFKEETLNKLKELAGFDDRKVTRATKPLNPDDPMSEWETELIDNPYPLHAQKGFIDMEESKKEDRIKMGWFELPKLIAVTEKRKYTDVLKDSENVKPDVEIEPIKEEEDELVEGIR